jgi:hypothetical protein
MRKVYKFNLPVADQVKVQIPRGAKILSADRLENTMDISVWALIDDKASYVTKEFSIRGTGHPANGLSGNNFVGTVIFRELGIVLHVWEGAPNGGD